MAAKKITTTGTTLTVVTALFALLALVIAPAAYAHHKDGHENGSGKAESSESDSSSTEAESSDDQSSSSEAESGDKDGDADSDPSTAYTEDNDTNDGGTANNVEDEGDNAHPSGKDRSVEHGKSGNQGKSESNPDDSKGPMRYEGELGPDKPNGPGGTDLADQDGNNGCGNDDDFNDDNNGWCGKPKKTKTPSGPCDKDSNMANGVQTCEEDVVEGEVITAPLCDQDADMTNGIQLCEGLEQSAKPEGDDVLGGVIKNPAAPEVLAERAATQPAVAGAALPFTGARVASLITIALGLVLVGLLLMRTRKIN